MVYRNKIWLGDAIEKMHKIPTDSVDHCITDPPYNISGYDGKKAIGWLQSNDFWTEDKKFNKMDEKWDSFTDSDYDIFLQEWLSEIFRIVKPNGNIAIFGTFHNIFDTGYMLKKNKRKIVGSVTWYKRNAFPNITRRMFCESTEYLIWAVNNDRKNAKNWTFNYDVLKEMNGGKQMRNMWDIPMTPPSEKRFGKHPNQKPIAVIEKLILGLTNEGDVVIDPFTGSGTIPFVAKKHKRNFIAIDKEKEFIEITRNRLKMSVPMIVR